MATDKSRGRGCITCKVEKGKTCDNCTHREDLVNKCRELNRQAST